MKTPVTIEGRQVGRLRASFLLFKETFRFLRADAEMMAVPIIAILFEMFLFGVLGIFLFTTGFFTLLVQSEGAPKAPVAYIALFLCYIVSAFVIAWMQAVITHIVYVRAHGSNATLGEGIKVAFNNWSALLLWSVITSTVGILLRAIADRSRIVGRIVVALIGTAWSVLTYFVVPSIIIGKRPAFDAIRDSGTIFKRTWGETLVTNISFSLVLTLGFFAYLIALFGIGFIMGWSIGVVITLCVLFVFGITILSLLGSTLGSILRTLLYLYASEGKVPENFNPELLEKMFKRKDSSIPNGVGTSLV